MKKNLKAASANLSDFRDAVIKYSQFMLSDPPTANQYYDRFIKALRQLSRAGDEGMSALATLLDDNDVAVRVMAATYLIRYRTKAAQEVLKVAAKMQDRAISMLAIVTLKRWEKGYYLDPETGNETKSN